MARTRATEAPHPFALRISRDRVSGSSAPGTTSGARPDRAVGDHPGLLELLDDAVDEAVGASSATGTVLRAWPGMSTVSRMFDRP